MLNQSLSFDESKANAPCKVCFQENPYLFNLFIFNKVCPCVESVLRKKNTYYITEFQTTASENPSSSNVLALGKALNQFLQRGNGDGSAAQGFLEGVISSGCASSGI